MAGKENITQEINIVSILNDIKISISNHLKGIEKYIMTGEENPEHKLYWTRYEALRRAEIILAKLQEIDYHMDVILKPIKFSNFKCNCGRCDGNFNKKRLEETLSKEIKEYFEKGIY